MSNILSLLADVWVWIIFLLAIVHLVGFIILLWAKKRRRGFIAKGLKEILDKSGFGTSAMAEHEGDDLIDACCQDLLAVLKESGEDVRLKKLSAQLDKFEDLKPYKKTSSVERWYNVARTGIEVYPLLGILGTILALGVTLLSSSSTSPTLNDKSVAVQAEGEINSEVLNASANLPGNDSGTGISAGETDAGTHATMAAEKIINNFGNAIWTTLWGLVFGIFFMMFNAWVELGFERLADHRRNIAEVVMWARKKLVPESGHEST